MNIAEALQRDKNYAWSIVDYDYDCDYDCDGFGCCDEGMCRCGTISNARVTGVNLLALTSLAFPLTKDTGLTRSKTHGWNGEDEEILAYCFNRLLTIRKAYESENWKVEVGGGYYGDEIYGVKLESESVFKIAEEMARIKKMSLQKKIEYLLKAEYGYLLESVENRKWRIHEISKDDLVFGQEEYKRKLSKEDLTLYREYSLPRGIAVRVGEKIRLIDGYHRCLASDCKTIRLFLGE